jgi:hypothetical protein
MRILLHTSICILGLLAPGVLCAQFAPAAGLYGTTAIWKDSSAFVEWATGCTVQRGYMNIADTTLGLASVGDEGSAIGMPGENGVVSLGDGGMATLTFDKPVYNGPGFDFAVFENGFQTGDSNLAFLEFAFVEVSSDGIHFSRFPAVSNTQDTVQLAMQGIDCALVNNLAGKYIAGYGTPFDLSELDTVPGLDINHITHIRLVDVVGSVTNQYATHDIYGHKVNDPWPTPFPSCGFDLDAVGVIHALGVTGVQQTDMVPVSVYPNPATKGSSVYVNVPGNAHVQVYDINGKLLHAQYITGGAVIPAGTFSAGLYVITVQSGETYQNYKLAVE